MTDGLIQPAHGIHPSGFTVVAAAPGSAQSKGPSAKRLTASRRLPLRAGGPGRDRRDRHRLAPARPLGGLRERPSAGRPPVRRVTAVLRLRVADLTDDREPVREAVRGQRRVRTPDAGALQSARGRDRADRWPCLRNKRTGDLGCDALMGGALRRSARRSPTQTRVGGRLCTTERY